MTAFLDTAVLIRYLTGDSPELSPLSRLIVEQVEGLTITSVAIAETAWVLESVYSVPRDAIVAGLTELLERANIHTFELNKRLLIEALLLCRPRRVSFPDALIWAAARYAGDSTVYSFDRRFPAEGIEVRGAP